MRVLWLSHFVPWPATGLGMLQRSHALLREASRRFEIHLVALNHAGLLESDRVEEARSELSGFCAAVDVFARRGGESQPVRTARLLRSAVGSTPYDVQWMACPPLSAFLEELRPRPDLVHVDTIGLAAHAERLGEVPQVLNHHNVESALLRRRASRERGWPARRFLAREAAKLERLERRVAPRARVNLVVSPLDGERLAAVAPGARQRVVANGVDTRYFAAQPSDGSAGLIFAGGMDWYPNRDAALFFVREIWPLLRRRLPGLSATFVGRSPPEELVEASRRGPLRAPGFVYDVRPFVRDAAIYVCPIRDGGGTRLKVLDALAMERPLVATALAVEGLGLREEREYLRAESAEEFVSQITRLVGQPALRAALARAGRRAVCSRFDWPVVGESLAAAYHEALDQPREGVPCPIAS